MQKYHQHYMSQALKQAEKAVSQGEVPIGCVIVDTKTDRIIAETHNLCETNHDATAHAEILAIRKAGEKLGDTRLPDCDLYVTLEPCPMCATAISFARIRRVYFGAYDPKGGGVDHGPKIYQHETCHHHPEIYGGIQESVCGDILKTFFKDKR